MRQDQITSGLIHAISTVSKIRPELPVGVAPDRQLQELSKIVRSAGVQTGCSCVCLRHVALFAVRMLASRHPLQL